MATWPVMLLGIVMVIVAIPAAITQLIAALFLLPIGIAIISSNHGFQINLQTNEYRESLFILGITFGKWHPFEAVEKIFINPTTERNTVYSRANQGYSYKKQKFASFIKFTNGTKIKLYELGDKKLLIKKLTVVANALAIEIHDNTQPPTDP